MLVNIQVPPANRAINLICLTFSRGRRCAPFYLHVNCLQIWLYNWFYNWKYHFCLPLFLDGSPPPTEILAASHSSSINQEVIKAFVPQTLSRQTQLLSLFIKPTTWIFVRENASSFPAFLLTFGWLACVCMYIHTYVCMLCVLFFSLTWVAVHCFSSDVLHFSAVGNPAGFFACFRAPLIETLQMYGSHLVLGWSKSGSLEPIPNPNPNPKPKPKPKRKERKIDVRAVNNFNGYRSVISIAMYMDLSEF